MLEILVADYSNRAHRQAVVELLDAYARDPMGGGEPLADTVRATLVDEMAKRPYVFSLLAFVDGRPVGLCNCIEGFSTFAARPLMNIHDIAVIEPFRGRGIARGMLAEVESIARARGCCKLTLEVLTGNTTARAAYLKFGFRPYRLDESLGNAEFWHRYIN
jgi:GNAT superfamily N-acetyltransferase